MRNISLSDFESKCIHKLSGCEAFYYDQQTLYAVEEGLIIKCQENDEEVICNLRDSLYPVTDEKFPKAVEITYLCEKDLLCVILSNGDIVSISPNDSASDSIVGSVDCGIKCAQWSPEQEVLVLVTGSDSMIIMTNDFDLVNEIDLHGGGFGEKQFITVGWGKKETQFRGSEGKFNSKEKEIKVNEILGENSENIKISWRGDAEYFVVSSVNPETSLRYLRIFSKSGILQYTSECFNGLDDCLSWRPSGSLIASTQQISNKYIVCFFEKNGLKHGEFELPFSYINFKVHEISWNKDSKILAVLFSKTSNQTLEGNKVNNFENVNWGILLYSVSNYQWQLKYTISFDLKSTPFYMQWDLQKYNTLHLVLKKENKMYHFIYSWLWVINKSRGSSLENESLVAVVNGCTLLVTSFNRGIIPPPMCSFKIYSSLPINAVTFGPADSAFSNDIVIQLSDSTVLVYKFILNNSNQISYELIGKTNLLNNDSEINYNVNWVASNKFMLCNVKVSEEKSKPFLKTLDIDNFGTNITFQKSEFLLNSTIAILRALKSLVIIHLNDGKLYKIDINNNKELDLYINDKKTLLEVEIGCKPDCNYLVFSLDNLNKFYIDGKLLFNNILSFHVHEKFVLLTNLKHQIVYFNFEAEIPIINNTAGVFLRRVERGAKIVTSVHKGIKVILQMPRGNLECIQPRALALFELGKYIDALNYFEAFNLMRKQRINLNLLYDHDPILFAKNVNFFIKNIKDPTWISLFISELCEEDVKKTMYSDFYKSKVTEVGINSGKSKINTVCEIIEKSLTSQENSEKYILPMLTCYIKRGEINYLETALLKLKNLKEKEVRGVKLNVGFDEAFRYVLYLIDVDELYKIALGMYDFELVLLIANKSQKDPKEYIPFLNELKKLETNYQKFVINKYLKRYKKALENLVLCDGDDVFNECLNFIKIHKLYKYALQLIPQNTDRYKNVCICYGDELLRSCFHEEAGIMYANAGAYMKAIEAYRKSGNWMEAISCGKELKLSKTQLNEMYIDLATELYDTKKFKEAAIIYLDYLQDIEQCVKILSNGKLFAEAYRIVNLHDRSDLINKYIVPEISEQGNLMNFHIANFSDTFLKQKNRLQDVRKQNTEGFENKEILNEDNDAYSETSTVFTESYASTQRTNKTYRSAKNRRKQERKLLSLKEGSPYEELALITSLHNIVTNCIALKPEVKELNKSLVKIKKYETAEKLQNELDKLLKTIEIYKSEIWTPDLLHGKQNCGPDASSGETSGTYIKTENVTSTLLNPNFAIPPETQLHMNWKLEFLTNNNS